jgi:hypothetical protein
MGTTSDSPAARDDLARLRVPKALRDEVGQMRGLTDGFCAEFLDEEYARLCRVLMGMLARKRPSPLARGDLRVWAAAVIYTVGANNFLSDRNSEPYLSTADLARLTGVATSTMANKAGAIRRCLGLDPLEPELCRRELLEDHPYAWCVEVDGILIDVRGLPAAVQDEARRRGWVPDVVALQGAGR